MRVTDLCLAIPTTRRRLITNLSFSLEPGCKRLAIVGPSGSGKSSLLRALCGLWKEGSGKIARPEISDLLFLPQKPYMLLGTLREQLLFPFAKGNVSDEQLMEALEKVNLGHLPTQFGGLDTTAVWNDVLSPGQQQLLAFGRVLIAKPRLLVMDEATNAMDCENQERVYRMVSALKISFISVIHDRSLLNYHDNVLTLHGDTTWTQEELQARLVA